MHPLPNPLPEYREREITLQRTKMSVMETDVRRASGGSESPAVLTYDNLPPHSTLIREILTDDTTGETSIKIIAPAGEPTARARRRIAIRSAIPAAAMTVATLAVCAVPIGFVAYNHRHLLPWWTLIIFTIFCAALYAFLWRGWRAESLARNEVLLRRNSVLLIRPQQLLIEATGPQGRISYEIAASRIRSVRAANREMPELVLMLDTDPPVLLLKGREFDELQWVAATVRHVMRLEERTIHSQ